MESSLRSPTGEGKSVKSNKTNIPQLRYISIDV